MREPAFWWRPRSWSSLALAPFGFLYGAVAAARLKSSGAACGLPVFCVGNYHLGGAGKTPTVLALLRLLTAAGERPFVLSRGYGGRQPGPVQVDLTRHTAADVGDEPLLLAREAPVIVARDRVAGAGMARALGASLVVMDDGFQNPSLTKQLSLIVVDAARGIGNGRVFPAGPLRAPLAPQLARTDALIIVGEGEAAAALVDAVAANGKLVLHAKLVPDAATLEALKGRRYLAFAGIGDPARFFATLRPAEIDLAAMRSFPDHYSYRAQDVAGLAREAKQKGLALVTTEKDRVRLAGVIDPELLGAISVLPVTMQFDDEARLRDRLSAALLQYRSSR